MADEQGFRIATAFVTIEPDAEDFSEKLKAAVDEAVAGIDATIPIKADLADFDAKVDEAKGKLDDLKSYDATPKLGLDKDEFDAGTDDAGAKLDRLDGKEAEAKLGLNKDDFDAEADEAETKLDDFDGREARAELGLDKDEFDAEMDEADARLDEFRAKSANASLGASGGGGAGSEGGGMLGAITGGVAALMPGLGGAATGLGLLGATGAMAFGGVAKAVSAAHQAATNIGETQQQLAATEFSNSVAIRQAQQALGAAHMQAAQDAQQAAMQITQSQMSLAETERNAASSMIAAQQAVGQAEHGLAESQYTEQQAQVSLTEARIQARIQLQQLADQVKDAALSEKSASLAVQQAKYQQQLTDSNAYSTSLDRQQASLAVAQAEQQLTEAQQNKANVTQEATGKDRQYFDGQQQVIQAEHALKDAIYGTGQARQQLANAERALTNTELNNATAVKEAQMAVRQAEQNAAYTAQRDALAVKQAQQNVTDTLKEQKLAYAATMASANQSALQYAKDMARLTPAGRQMVREILSLRGAFHAMISAAQNAVAPGIDLFLRGLKSLMPDVTTGVRLMGDAIGHAFALFGRQMDTKSFRDVLNGLIRNGIQFANTVLPAVAQFVQELGRIGGQKGAASGLANLLAGLVRGFTGLARVIGQNEGPINQLLTAIGRILTAAGPELGQMLGIFVRVLEPITRFLNSKAGAPFVKMLGGVVAGMLAWKVASAAVIGPMGKLFEIPGKIGGGWEKVFGKDGEGGIARGVLGFARSVGSGMRTAGSAVASFVSDYASRIGQAAIATGAWIAEHTVATATFIAENVAQAASATAAFIAENAASLGLVAAIGGLVAAAVYLATHWKQVWGDVKRWAEDAWHFIWDGFGKYLLPLLGPAGLIALGAIELAKHWQQIMKAIGDAASFLWHQVIQPVWQGIKQTSDWLYQNGMLPLWHGIDTVFGYIRNAAEFLWHNVFDPVWHGIEAGARDFVSAFETVWHRLESVFKTPVNFLISTVYDKGIARLWNDVVTHIGLGSIKLPVIPTMAGGGVLPGYAPGRDTVPAMLSPGEGVLTPQATRGLGGEQGIGAINSHFSGSSGGGGGIGKSLAKMPVKEIARRATERPALHAATLGHFASGGVAGSKSSGGGGLLGGLWHDITGGIAGAIDLAKIVAAVATGNTAAFTNAAGKLIGTHAAGDLAKMMIGVPKTLVADAAKQLVSMFSSSAGGKLPGGSTGAIGSLPANWKTIASFLASHGFTKAAAAGVSGNIFAESGGDPEILEAGGGGGGGLIQWTPYPAGYITGNYLGDLMTQLHAILSWSGGPGIVNRGTSPSNAAQIYQDYYERPANLTASLPARMASANAVYKAMGWGKFDAGGWLMPTGLMPGGGVNTTGQPEAVLTPAESAAFVALVKRWTSQQGAGGPGGATVVQNFVGGGFPSAEQSAAMKRELALALAGP